MPIEYMPPEAWIAASAQDDEGGKPRAWFQVRLALMHPGRVRSVVLVNPLGLNDTLAEGVPYADIATLRAEEAKTDAASIRAYQLRTYYHGVWRRDYDRWVDMLAGMYAGPGRNAVIEAQARTTEMIETQPVASEFGRITVPTVVMVGSQDRNFFGRAWLYLCHESCIPIGGRKILMSPRVINCAS